MNAGEDPSAGPENALSKSRAIEVAAEAKVDVAIKETKSFGVSVFGTIQFVLFFVFLLTAILRFWLFTVTLVLHLLRVVIYVLTLPLGTVSGANPPRSVHKKRHASSYGIGANLHYELVKPLAHLWAEFADAVRSFWHYSVPRKTLVVVMGFFLVFVPASYLIPRPHTVQILDNNVLNNNSNGASANSAAYLIHAIDIDDPSHTREYINENAWWLGKVNSQGLKARMVPGRYFRVLVVGLRWWFAPTLYPNIISVTEIDGEGNALANNSTPTPTTTNDQ
jgi:hypothetical protein